MVTSMLTCNLQRLQNVSRQISGEVAKFGGHSLKCFEVIRFFNEGASKAPIGLIKETLPVL